MGLLSPWFLAGGLAIGLPIWLHFLRQHRSPPQPFSSLMFFERRVQVSSKVKRLQHLLLLALRVVLLLLIALAFANPFVNQDVATSARRTLAVLVVDRSFSMRYGDHLARAKAAAAGVIEGLPATEQAEVAALDSSFAALTQPERSKDSMRAAVDAIQPTDQTASFAELTRALRVLEPTTKMRLDVHVFSDLQRTALPASFADLTLGPQTALTLHAARARQIEPNWAVETVVAPAHVFAAKQVHVIATVAGWNTPERSATVRLLLEGRPIAEHPVHLPANGRATVEFGNVAAPYGNHRAQVCLDSQDRLPQDDCFPFGLERSDPLPALFITSDGRGRADLYYRRVLESVADSGLVLTSRPADDTASLELKRFSYIVLADPGGLPSAAERRLTDYVEQGGSLLILCGPEVAGRGRVPVTGESLSAAHELLPAGPLDGAHPAVAGIGRLENVLFSQPLRLMPSASSRILARLGDGSPLLTEKLIGEGRVLTFGSTFDNTINDFPLHSSFVPFVLQTARYLSGQDETAALSLTVRTPIELRRGRQQALATQVVDPDGRHPLTLKEEATALNYAPDREGFYEIKRASGRATLAAVYADRRESDLTPIPAETLSLWQAQGARAPAPTAGGTIERGSRIRSFWQAVLVVALLAAAAESLVADRYLTWRASA